MIDLQEPGLVEYIGESVIIIGHHNADPDAVGAAQGVKELVERLKPGVSVSIVMPDDISKISTQLIENLGLEVHEEYSGEFDTIIIVDSGGLNQIGVWEQVIRDHQQVSVVIDHHTLDDNISKCVDLLIHDENASSTCEIVHRLYKQYKLEPSVTTVKALIAGIAFDSKFFSIGSSETFGAVSELLSYVGDVSDILSLFQSEIDISERIACIKTAQRTELHRINDYIVVFSEIGSYQASGARALISLGADLTVVVGEKVDSLRASLRSTQRFFDSSGLHLGELVSEYADEHGGSGNGHPTAAGYNGEGEYTVFSKDLLKIITSKIG